MIMPDSANHSALRWRCRRGMLELDIIFNTFLDKAYADLSQQQKQLLDQILDYPDALLFDLFLGKMTSSDKDICHFITHIRHTIKA
jgi:antitoxin CptB